MVIGDDGTATFSPMSSADAASTQPVNTLLAIENEVVALSDRLGRTVVAIEGARPTKWATGTAKSSAVAMPVRGSGFLLSSDGLILTNEHVVRGCNAIKVRLADSREFTAKLVSSDGRSDLAVLSIPATNLPYATLGNADALRRGQWVLAMGNPLGLSSQDGQPAVSLGVVSAIGRSITGVDSQADRYYGNLIQTTAQIVIGHSGGPLFNLKGEVVGINTIVSTMDVSGEHVAFAVPISKWTRRIIERLRTGQAIEYGYLGLTMANVPGQGGAAVVDVQAGTPAAQAGLLPKDHIVSYDEERVRNFDDAIRMIGLTLPGRPITLQIVRNGETIAKSVVIGRRSDYVTASVARPLPQQPPTAAGVGTTR